MSDDDVNNDSNDSIAENSRLVNPEQNNTRLRKMSLPSQIPLLEDVVNDLNAISEKALESTYPKKPRPPEVDPLDKPLATDLFGDPIHSYAVVSENQEVINTEELHSQAKQVVNSLVKEYSHEIVRRLRNELTSVLNDLSEEKSGSSAGQQQTSETKEEPKAD